MSKAISTALKAHYASGSTTIARCWRIQRKDGFVITVNNSDRDITYAAEVYQSKAGATPTAIEGETTGSVQNSEVDGPFDPTTVASDADLSAGLYDGATVDVFEVNYADLTMGRVYLQGGTIGNVSASRAAFKAEVRGLMQAMQQSVGRVYTASCSATLGDARCKVNMAPLTVSGTITAVDSGIGRRQFTDTGRTEYQSYFANGVITWLTGLNAGLKEELASFAFGVMALKLPMPYNVAVGDTYTIVPGCNKLLKVNKVMYGSVGSSAAGGGTTIAIYDSTRTEGSGTFIGGTLTWTSGGNNGTSFNIVSNSPGGVTLQYTPSNPIYAGDSYLVSPPASAQMLGDCKVKFNNVVNHRGFPSVPGNDTIMGLATS